MFDRFQRGRATTKPKDAREFAATLGANHFDQIVKPHAIDLVPKLAWHYDEPFADSSAVPTYYVSQIARQHVTVALSGDGGDESFAGYRRYKLTMWEEQAAISRSRRVAAECFRPARPDVSQAGLGAASRSARNPPFRAWRAIRSKGISTEFPAARRA